MTPSEQSHQNLFDYCALSYRIVKARAKTFWIIAAIIVLGVIAAAYGRSPKFETRAKLVVKLDLQTFVLSQSEVRYNLATKMADEAVGTQVELLNSSALVQGVIDELGEDILDGKPKTGLMAAVFAVINGVRDATSSVLVGLRLVNELSPRERLAKTISMGLKVLPARKSQTIDISLRLKNREAAQKILTSLINLHLQKLRVIENNPSSSANYSAQSAELRTDLAKREAAVVQFKQQYQFVDLEKEKLEALDNYQRLKNTLDGVLDVNISTEIQLPVTAGPAAASIGGGTDDAAELASRVNQLRIELQGRSAIYAAGHVKLEEIQDQLKITEQLLNKKIRNIIASANRYWERSRTLDALTPEYNRLRREVEVHEELYRNYLKATEAQRLANIKDLHPEMLIIDPPNLPEAPAGPSRLMVVLGGILAALVFAALGVLGLHALAQRKRMSAAQA